MDVNVHPTKKEIRFDDEFKVEDFIRESVARTLMSRQALPQIRKDVIKDVPEAATVRESVVSYEERDVKTADTDVFSV